MSKFYALGLGVDPVHHCTVETLQAMGACASVFVCGTDPKQRAFLSRFCAKGALKPFEASAEAQAEGLILRELEAGRDAGLATPGHPFYFSGLAGRILKKAASLGFELQTFGAISPMGVAISAAGITLGTDVFGLQSFDCAALARRDVVINPEWPLTVHFYGALSPADFDRAAERLLAAFPKKHPMLWCRPDGSEASTLDKLKASSAKASLASVLYLPEAAASTSKTGRGDDFGKALRGVSAPAWVKE